MSTFLLKPVTVPPEILNLKDTKPSEKLALAMFATNPEISMLRLHRALSITHAGFKKLLDRLVAKGLLSQRGVRHMISVPNLVYLDHPDGGHFVPDSEATKNEHKVAPPASTTSQVIVIPAEILDLKDVGASEKFLLSVYAATPTTQNEQVLEALGISRAGLKKVKRRLIQCGLLTKSDAGYRIHVPGLVFVENPEGGHFVSEKEALEIAHKVAPTLKKVTPAGVIWDELLLTLRQFEAEGIGTALVTQYATADAIKQVEAESPEGPERDRVLAVEAGWQRFAMLPMSGRDWLIGMLVKASPERLTEIRNEIEAAKARGACVDLKRLLEG